jgi:hypothetical protein
MTQTPMPTPQTLATFEERLHQPNRQFTVGDVASLTGLHLDDAERLLYSMMAKYECRLQVTDAGSLVYDFGETLLRRGEKTWAERWAEAKAFMWQAFVVFFRIWLSVMLVAYFVVFLVVLLVVVIGAVVALFAGDGDGDGGDWGLGLVFEVMGELFQAIFWWNYYTPVVYYDYDAQGNPYQRYTPKESAYDKAKKKRRGQQDLAPKKTFIASVYDYVFGPPRVELHPLANQREVAAFLRQNRGLITTAEVRALAGWDSDTAAKFFTDCLVRFNGRADLDEHGVLIGEFDELVHSANQEKDAKVVWYWDEYEPEYPLTGNRQGRNVGITAMNVFNLVFSLVVLGATASDPTYPGWVAQVLGWFPLAFSAIFFAVPGLREWQLRPKRRQRHRNNLRKRVMKVLYQMGGKPVAIDEIFARAYPSTKPGQPADRAEFEQVLNDLAHDLQGDVQVNEQGQVTYQFFRLDYELSAIRQQRGARAQQQLGQVVFDTSNPWPGLPEVPAKPEASDEL